MKVPDLIEKLREFNPDAEVEVIALNRRMSFSLCWGSDEGVTKETCNVVFIDVNELNQSESAG